MLSEVSQTQKDSTICSLSYVEAKNDIWKYSSDYYGLKRVGG
jgi:hypothetical protein